jgi:hypothetical protein
MAKALPILKQKRFNPYMLSRISWKPHESKQYEKENDAKTILIKISRLSDTTLRPLNPG